MLNSYWWFFPTDFGLVYWIWQLFRCEFFFLLAFTVSLGSLETSVRSIETARCERDGADRRRLARGGEHHIRFRLRLQFYCERKCRCVWFDSRRHGWIGEVENIGIHPVGPRNRMADGCVWVRWTRSPPLTDAVVGTVRKFSSLTQRLLLHFLPREGVCVEKPWCFSYFCVNI